MNEFNAGANAKGEPGDVGETGEKGVVGEAGDKGETGDEGDQGDTGATGDQGATGEPGDQGEQVCTGWVHDSMIIFRNMNQYFIFCTIFN